MTRIFEWRRQEVQADDLILIDLDKICMVRVEKPVGHHYPQVYVRFVDGNEDHDTVPPEAAQRFVEAYRAYLQQKP